MNEVLCAGMTIVVLLFLAAVVRAVWACITARDSSRILFTTRPRSICRACLPATSVAVLTYIGFDAVSTFSEEVENPRRNIMLATVLVCLITGVLSGRKCMRRN